jgi:chemotaxis protein CheD
MPPKSELTGKDFERLALTISPGGWAVGTERPISTLLGSCVSVCFYDPKLKLGGMNHFLLPSKRAGANDDTEVVIAGDFAMEVLFNALLAKGARKERLVAKAFGGGNIVSSLQMAIGVRRYSVDWFGFWWPLVAQGGLRAKHGRRVLQTFAGQSGCGRCG